MQYATAKQMQESLGAPKWKFTNAFLIKNPLFTSMEWIMARKEVFSAKKIQKIFDQNL